MERQERAILVFTPSDAEMYHLEIKERELKELAMTAGIEVVDLVMQKRRGNHRMLGRGKAQEIALQISAEEIDVVVFDEELSPSEMRIMEEQLACKIIDRAALILDIFAKRAQTREGKLQVEMAQLSWLLPRLTGKGKSLSRLGGGVGTRGPGETQLETDRRHIRRRFNHVKRALAEVVEQRKTQRASRQKMDCPYVVLVGYTNAGKSSLLNRLTDSDIYVADQLFATLDSTTRRLSLPSGALCFISDTVGFIRDLPPHLTIAFKATLEILQEADVLLHVVDVSEAGFEERIKIVDNFIADLKADEIPKIYVLNKVDAIPEPPILPLHVVQESHCFSSALSENGINELLQLLEEVAMPARFSEQIVLPYGSEGGRLMAMAHQLGNVSHFVHDEHSMQFLLEGDVKTLEHIFKPYIKV